VSIECELIPLQNDRELHHRRSFEHSLSRPIDAEVGFLPKRRGRFELPTRDTGASFVLPGEGPSLEGLEEVMVMAEQGQILE
jgi:hypothetical protein